MFAHDRPPPSVVVGADRAGWPALGERPGAVRSGGRGLTAFATVDGAFACGLWEREPGSWSFEAAADEVAFVVAGDGELETTEPAVLPFGPGDVVIVPAGSGGTWRVGSTLTTFFVAHDGAAGDDATIRRIGADDDVPWQELERPEGDEAPPGEEWIAWRSADRGASAGVWRRVAETGPLERSGFDEISVLIDGQVDVETERGEVLRVGPGDVLVTPDGTRAVWRARTAVRKFWTVHHVRG